MIRIKYIFKTGANPQDPNEQVPGVIISDDRIFGLENITLTTNGQSYNEESFSKSKDSNTLTVTMPDYLFTNGQIVILDATN